MSFVYQTLGAVGCNRQKQIYNPFPAPLSRLSGRLNHLGLCDLLLWCSHSAIAMWLMRLDNWIRHFSKYVPVIQSAWPNWQSKWNRRNPSSANHHEENTKKGVNQICLQVDTPQALFIYLVPLCLQPQPRTSSKWQLCNSHQKGILKRVSFISHKEITLFRSSVFSLG